MIAVWRRLRRWRKPATQTSTPPREGMDTALFSQALKEKFIGPIRDALRAPKTLFFGTGTLGRSYSHSRLLAMGRWLDEAADDAWQWPACDSATTQRSPRNVPRT